MKSIRMLIVEDEPELLATLKKLYREAFSEYGFSSVTIEQASEVDEARDLARSAKEDPYDFVSLDVNLGDHGLTGLDVLSSLRRFQSAWMVAMLTGVETDTTLDETLGAEAGENLRKQLRRDAYAKFPAERLVVVEKPSTTLSDAESDRLLADRVRQIALIYIEAARMRYIFRPIKVLSLERVMAQKGKRVKRKFIETTALHWQIRFNCGDLRTLSDKAGFRTLHHLLSMPREESLTPEQALVVEPKKVSAKEPTEPGEDPVAEYFESQGIAWKDLGRDEQDKLIAAALSLRFKRYVELREFQDDEDLSAEESDELDRLINELGPLHSAAETAYTRLRVPEDLEQEEEISVGAAFQDGLHTPGGNYEKSGDDRRGYDSPAAKNFRARWKRTKDYLRENGFAEMAEHMESYVQSTGASWSYNPPMEIEWTT